MCAFRQIIVVLLGLGAAAVATAEQYWVSYEAENTFPEDEGWMRYALAGGAQRWFDDGALVIDSRASPSITEVYAWYRPVGQFDPQAPNEWLSVSWRLRIDELQGFFDPTVGVYSDDHRAVAFDFRTDRVYEASEGAPIATFEAGLYHEFEVRTVDVLTYNFYVDGVLAHTGSFWSSVGSTSFVSWGSNTLGGASLTHWDYMRFGVAPEPLTFWLVLGGGVLVLKSRA